jgi:dihydrolipoamide dehydrogenase
MDAEMAKQFQKMLTKQGFKFKLSTKVVSGKLEKDKVYLEVDAAKGGKPETVSSLVLSPANAAAGCRYCSRLNWSSAIH